MIAAWITFLAAPYLLGHSDTVTGGVGAVGQNVDANVGRRLTGSDDHLLIVRLRLLASVALWALAAGGVVLAWRRRQSALVSTALLAAPFLLLVLQPYGGEALLRVYFFALPFTAYHAAGLLAPYAKARLSWVRGALVGSVLVVFAITLLFTRYGNERADFFTEDEIQGVERL